MTSRLHLARERIVIVDDSELVCLDFSGIVLLPVHTRELIVADTAGYPDFVSFLEVFQPTYLLTFPCIDIMPLGVDDGAAISVRISQIGGNREARHLFASDLLELHSTYEATQFDFVDLFHILWFFGPMQR